MKIDGVDFSWTQPACETCFAGVLPKCENPVRIREDLRDEEVCCMCGRANTSGLFIRVNPSTVPHPTPKK